jgi:peptidyl-prolyl cis-trans isomerase C
MSCRWLVWFMISLSMAMGQTAKPGPGDQGLSRNDAGSASHQVPPDTPVITIQGVCDNGFSDKSAVASSPDVRDKNCRTVVTRAQFEKLVDALLPVAPPAAKRKFANDYPENLLFAEKARQTGLDKDPDFEESLKFTILRALSTEFVKHAQDQARDISDADIEKVYKEHPELFLKIDLLRIYVPKEKEPPSQNQTRAAVEAEMRAVAEKIRAQAAAGGDFEQLQEEAYKDAGMSDPPEVNVGEQTRGTMSLDYQKAAFELEPGQVSQVVLSPIGFHIFKISSKKMVPLSEAKPILQSLRFRETIAAAKKNLKWELNEEYFKVPPPQAPQNQAQQNPPGAAAGDPK